MCRRSAQAGFTLIELMIVVVIIGILAAIAIPNFAHLMDTAKEGSTKANMHSFQMAAEDYGTQNDGVYGSAATVAGLLLGTPAGANFKNPFSKATGSGVAWVAGGTYPLSTNGTGSTVPGITAYLDSSSVTYQIRGRGKIADLPLSLTTGQ